MMSNIIVEIEADSMEKLRNAFITKLKRIEGTNPRLPWSFLKDDHFGTERT